MTTSDEMGLTAAAAQGYETFFVPAIFHQWPQKLIAAARIEAHHHVLDVGCGTGVVTRALARHVGEQGHVSGLDLSESMLGVARQQCPSVTFKQGHAQRLPFADDSFDVVLSAFMLMFVDEPQQALREMSRVVRPGGQIVVSVWQGLADNPVYEALVAVARDVLDDKVAEAIAWPFNLGDGYRLAGLFAAAGLDPVVIEAHAGDAQFPSVEELVRTEVQAWLLAGQVDAEAIDKLSRGLRATYADFGHHDGPVRFPLNALIASTTVT